MRAYLSLGSNIQPAKNIPRCLRKIRKTFRLRKISSIYKTSPVGPVGPPKGPEGKRKFWNLAVQIETSFSRPRLGRTLKRLELELGRRRKGRKFAPRPIDIDLALYGNWKRAGFERLAFALFPLAEIAPRLRLSGTKRSLSRLAREFYDPEQKIRKIRKRVL